MGDRNNRRTSEDCGVAQNDADDIVIVAAVRTPLCRARKGGFANVPASTLLETVLREVLVRAKNSNNSALKASEIDDICVGNVLLPPSGFAALRMAAIMAGYPAETTSLHSTNRQCASGLQAIANIAQAIQCKQIRIGIAAGVESMSLHGMPASFSNKLIDWKNATQYRQAMDCLLPMGITSETVVQRFGLERSVLDKFAAQSHQKAAAAQKQGKFRSEIVPVTVHVSTSTQENKKKSNNTINKKNNSRTKTVIVRDDDGIREQTTMATLSKLRPAFVPKTGITTAGNSSQLTDGAAAVLVMTRSEAQQRGLPILAVWKGYATAGVPPDIMGIGPVAAIPKVLQQTRLKDANNDIDCYELNEAFASQAVYCIDTLRLDSKKVNVNGGAIALGHPLGCTGTRLVVSLIHELQRRRQRPSNRPLRGVVSMCIGSGMGAAAVLEVESSSKKNTNAYMQSAL